MYFNTSWGSGEVSSLVIGYNIHSDETYNLSEIGERHYRVFLDNGKLKVKTRPYFTDRNHEVIGELELNEYYFPKLLVKMKN